MHIKNIFQTRLLKYYDAFALTIWLKNYERNIFCYIFKHLTKKQKLWKQFSNYKQTLKIGGFLY